MKHQELLKKLIPELKADPAITAVMLMGSVAAETENEYSDLNLFILGTRNKHQSEMVDGILVESIYTTQETAQSKLDKSGTEVYHYLGSKILYDMDGKLIKLMRNAMNKYKKYKASEKDKAFLRQYLNRSREKMKAAIGREDSLQADYITTITTARIIEAVFAINDIPQPPTGKIFHELDKLKHIPEPGWFENLLNKNVVRRTETALLVLDWVLELI